ncbi:ATP-dependent DNA helicase [Clostridiaceae bacterium]|nr:ATP-dependent DNA helicase [Clostridiaceae bacterium]RKI18071.1 ATP-dependent DNA helicase [bacterium 1XD21-70]
MGCREKKIVKISVRSLVEFVMRGGDIDNRRSGGAERDAMQAGSRIHRKIQRRMGADYQAEVTLKHVVESEEYRIVVEGRADGVISSPEGTVIDEIKGVYRDVSRLEEPVLVHLAQALCYGYIYACQHNLKQIGIQVTYCNIETEEIRRFRQDKSFAELEEWFGRLIGEYKKWAEYQYQHGILCEEYLQGLKFPYEYREGQKELAVSVYRALKMGKNLFIQAPTGIGKTLSTVYPALKAMGDGKGEKLFYLTAKTITRSVAEECFGLLREHGLFFSTVTITAKEKLCPLEKAECNPVACSLAKGHFDRVNAAVFDIIHQETGITRELVLRYADKHHVCPFEFCLDISNWVDGIICDYNYVFDPNVRLKRYFADGVSGEYLFLVDEAHNLVHRAREMFSAALEKEDFLTVKRILKGKAGKVEKRLERCNRLLLEMKRECGGYQVKEDINLFASSLMELFGEMENMMEDPDAGNGLADWDMVLDFYFQVRHFLNMYENLDEHYRIYTELGKDGELALRLFCIDPSRCLSDCLEKGHGGIFFSATLLPVLYYKNLLSGKPGDYAVYAQSPFPQENRLLMIGSDVSSRYTRRNQGEYGKVVDYICAVARSHKGNYMVFFPSYRYMESVEELLQKVGDGSFSWSMQKGRMTEEEREAFLADFEGERDRSFVGLCVLGGIFSEGIDLKAERLEGVVIVGTGLPMVCTEQEILKGYFEERMENGYDYAYQYPGMNKVMQAAGRVIRTGEDRGIILLLDDRFLWPRVQAMFPREWSEYAPVTRSTVSGWLERFWNGKGFRPS